MKKPVSDANARKRKPPGVRTAPRKRLQALEVVRRLHQTYPDANCELNWKSPLHLLIATILSAQSTDVNVNRVTQTLFKKYRKPADYLKVDEEELQRDIHSTGFFRSKARSVRGTCHILLEKYGGEVPRTMEELLELPGVARKTANVVLGTAFGIPSGVVVDTHIRRVSFRLGWTKNIDPVKIEADLIQLLPQEEWIFAGHAIIWHGRRICHARLPKCLECPLYDACPRRGVTRMASPSDASDLLPVLDEPHSS